MNEFFDIVDDKTALHLKTLGFIEPTEVQEKSLPFILEGDDCQIQAKTGSGKTLSFALGLLPHLKEGNLTSVILAPTRELVLQIKNEIQNIVRVKKNIKVLALYGGAPINEQLNSAKHGANIIVATPSRFLRIQDVLLLKDISYFVLDEADRLFEMGFEEDVEKIAKLLPPKRQTLFFSATYPQSLHVNNFLTSPQIITTSTCKESINEWMLRSEDKIKSIKELLNHYMPESAIIFCNSKQTTMELHKTLKQNSYPATMMHGEMKQSERIEALETFISQATPLLVATEVAARGLDIPKVEIIINYDVPRTLQSYTHRIGRTGRHEEKGDAITLVQKSQFDMIEKIEKQNISSHPPLHVKGEWRELKRPSTLCIYAGKDRKLRKGDIIGALINECNYKNEDILNISLYKSKTYVGLKEISNFSKITIKNKTFKCKFIS